MEIQVSIINIFYDNIREISKREKLLGLNYKSWIVILGAPMIIAVYISWFYAFISFLSLIAIFFIAEFFDDDISDILIARVTLHTKTNKYYA